jgi:glutathione synthase/RimK-type ligase-like ATP-grasp enzyme
MVELIYENDAILEFYETALTEIDVSFRLNFIESSQLDITQPPDDIIYLNCVSADADLRGHKSAIIQLEQYLEHLAAYNRKVVNDYRTIDYMISKVAQFRLMKRFGLTYPQAIFSSNSEELLSMAASLALPATVCKDQSSRLSEKQLCSSMPEIKKTLKALAASESTADTWLVQQYVEPRDGVVTRVEFFDESPVYAYSRPEQTGPESLNVSESEVQLVEIPEAHAQLMERYGEMCHSVGFRQAGVDFVTARNGSIYTLEVSGTTSYPGSVEDQTGHKARRSFQEMIRQMELS